VPWRLWPSQGVHRQLLFPLGLDLILGSSSSDDFGRDDGCSSGLRWAASAFMRQQWSHMRHVSTVPSTTPDAEEDIDQRPSWEPATPTVEREWGKTISTMKRKVSTLTVAKEAAHFRTSLFPPSLLHVEADLKNKKPFKEAVQRTNVAGACGLALVRCGELAYSALGQGSELMTLLNGAISGESPRDAASLLKVLHTIKGNVKDVRHALADTANVGARLAAGSFNQGIDEVPHQVWDSPLAKVVKPTLECCPPSSTHLFGDDGRIKEALEADRRRPYQAASSRSKTPRQRQWKQGGKSASKSAPSKCGKPSRKQRGAGKAPGPHSKKGEGQKNQ
jgi:hypothetical protein